MVADYNEMNLSEIMIKKRVASGVVVLGIRRVLYQAVLTFSGIVLARMLAPEIFGEFAIIMFLVHNLGMLTNFGMAQALVQKKDVQNKEEQRVVWTLLILASLVFVAGVYLLAPTIDRIYGGELGEQGIFWLRLFSWHLLIINSSSISGVLLERQLAFVKLTMNDLVTITITQIAAIILALKGFGVGSFVLGHLLGALVSSLLFFLLAPWPIGLSFSFRKLHKYLSFGLNFQATSVMGAVNGAVVPGFVGAVSGSKAVGLVNWAGGLRQATLAPVEVVGKLVFSACSRAQDNRGLLKTLIERMTQLVCMLSFPLITAVFVLAYPITYIIYTSAWLAGLTALYLSLIQGVFLLLGEIFVQVLFALGKAKEVRNISIFWAITQWVLTVPLVLFWNFNGVVLAGILVSATFFLPLREIRKVVDIEVWTHIFPYAGYSLITGLIMYVLTRLVVIDSLVVLLEIGMAGALVYVLLLTAFRREMIIRDFKIFYQLLRKSD